MDEHVLDIKNYTLKLKMTCLYYSVVFDGWIQNKVRNKNEIFAVPYCEKYGLDFLREKAKSLGYLFEELVVKGLATPKTAKGKAVPESDWIVDWPDKSQKEYEKYVKIQVPNECLMKLVEVKSSTQRIYEFKIWRARKML